MKGEAAPAKFFVHILSSKSTMLFVESQDIKPGMRLAKPVYNRNGVLLFDRNTKLTIHGQILDSSAFLYWSRQNRFRQLQEKNRNLNSCRPFICSVCVIIW